LLVISVLRKIVGILSTANIPYVNGVGKIILLDNSYTATASYLISTIYYATDNLGRIFDPLTPLETGITIWCNAESTNQSRYRFTYPDNRFFDFSLLPGNTEINISTLRDQGVLDFPQPTILDVVNQTLAQQWEQTLALLGTDYLIATASLSALRIINLSTGTYASSTDISQVNSPKGFLSIAVINGQQFPVQFTGIKLDLSWDWDITKPIFLGSNGTLIQTTSGLAYLQQVASVITSNKIILDFQEPLIL
jgi:hypothetical protein